MASGVKLCFGPDEILIPASSSQDVADSLFEVAVKLVELHAPGLPVALGGAGKYRVAVEARTALGAFVCLDAQQLRQTMTAVCESLPSTTNTTFEVVVLVAVDGATDLLSSLRTLHRADLTFLVEGSLRVVLWAESGTATTSGAASAAAASRSRTGPPAGQSTGRSETSSLLSSLLSRIPFDTHRPPTVSELEDLVSNQCVAGSSSSSSVAVRRVGWRRVGTSIVHWIDGFADVKALTTDVAMFGFDGVELVCDAEVAPPPNGRGPAVAQPVRTNASVGSSSGTATTSAGSRKSAPPTGSSAQHKCTPGTSGGSGGNSATNSVANKKKKATTAAARANVNQSFAAEDDDVDYVIVSYVLNPPVITVIGYLGDDNLAALCHAILERCVTSWRLTHFRGAPPSFERAPQNVGVYPVHTLTLARSYFDEAQEMLLVSTVLDVLLDDVGGFRFVPMDQLALRSTTTMGDARERAQLMLNTTAVKAKTGSGIRDAEVAKRSASLLFVAV